MDVVIADGIPEVRSALRLLLSEEPGMRVAGPALVSGHMGGIPILRQQPRKGHGLAPEHPHLPAL